MIYALMENELLQLPPRQFVGARPVNTRQAARTKISIDCSGVFAPDQSSEASDSPTDTRLALVQIS